METTEYIHAEYPQRQITYNAEIKEERLVNFTAVDVIASFRKVCINVHIAVRRIDSTAMRKIITIYVILLSLHVGYTLSNEEWWHSMSLYQIYPRSFKDSDGDGEGDLKGIIDKLEHLVESNIDAFWLSPIYPSPMVDSGYDISDFVSIDPSYGIMEDFEALVNKAHRLGLKIIMDLVPNHSSDKHVWFQKSLRGIQPYTNYYIWHKGKMLNNGTRTLPNNWVSVFGGSAWTWSEKRQAYYFHQFAPEQPDLNYNNKYLVNEMKKVMRFWLDKGIDGFRVDAVPHLYEDNRFLNEPLSGDTTDPNDYGYTNKIYTKDQSRTYDMVRQWRKVLDEYSTNGKNRKIMMIEAYSNISMTMKYYEYGAHFPFNFGMITDTNQDSKAIDFERMINKWMSNSPPNVIANWVAGNHDKSRLVTRYKSQLAKAVTILTLLLPGVSVTYNGEEIGMNDTRISWEDTRDPQGCNAGKDRYESASRDPARTPFQWDGSTSAGFSKNLKTWLPVNENYVTLNLAVQKMQEDSYYVLYKAVSSLRSLPIIKKGNFSMKLFNDNVLGFRRYTKDKISIYVIVNFGKETEIIDMTSIVDKREGLFIYYTTTNHNSDKSSLFRDTIEDVRNVKLSGLETTIYIGQR